ncbi:unnamed protein product [Oppiella nova]|uniref:Protein kinase domain-containing protein n=1 Tax=Oppiella nova TaxID=334625 RepID=A0A7R9QCK3_9ACAR|nr:unnamed protein product [Oppiella nova]CAG2163198.1 unnamed protein product [Oppiella nova]
MANVLDKFSQLKKYVENNQHVLKLFYVFDDYMGKNFIYQTHDDQYYVFGSNHYGCLGLGHNKEVEYPVLIAQLSNKGITEFYKGCNFMFGRTPDNEYYCWGGNECGQLGLGITGLGNDFVVPIRNEYLSGKNVVFLSCGYKHVLALTETGEVYAWGDNRCGQVGCGNLLDIINTPIKLAIGDTSCVIESIACGDHHSIALTQNGDVYVWGSNEYGQLATGNYNQYIKPQLLAHPGWTITKIVCSKNTTYYLSTDRDIYYCGQRYINGDVVRVHTLTKLETNTYETNETNLLNKTNKGKGIKFTDIFSANPYNWCFAKADGYNLPLLPRHLLNFIRLFHIFDDINGGKNCIYIGKDDTVYGLGSNGAGILGVGTTGPIEEPMVIKDLSGKGITKIYNGSNFMIATSKTSEVFVWGSNQLGQLGLGFECEYSKPCKNQFLSDAKLTQLSCGAGHTLALTENGEVYGWGSNEWGQVGINSIQQVVSVPTRIAIYIKFSSVSCGDYHSMALTGRTSVYSWGRNNFGQLGHFGCEKEIGPTSILMSNVRTIISTGNNSYVLTNYGDINVYGHVVCEHNLTKSQTRIPMPGNAQYIELEPLKNGLIIARYDDCVHEVKQCEILESLGKNSYRNYLANEFGITYQAIRMKAYERQDILGTGSFGLVYKCRDRQTDRVFTLKKLKCPGLNGDQMCKLEQALDRIKNLKNCYLAQMDKYWIEKNRFCFIQMPFYENTLLDIMIAKPHAFGRKFGQTMDYMEFYITCELFAQLVDGMSYLHGLSPPIIHRNLKTTNIFVTSDGLDNSFIKIADYGFEKFDKLGVKPIAKSGYEGLSKYTALEVIKGRKYGLNADVYSLDTLGHNILFVTNRESVYGLGTNSSGQLGLGHNTPVETAHELPELRDFNVRQFYVGFDIVLALTSEHRVFVWGHLGEYGKPVNNRNYSKPHKILFDNICDNIVITQISCGVSHALVLDERGRVFGWGCNLCGQLAVNPNVSVFMPNAVEIQFQEQCLCGVRMCMLLTAIINRP